MAFAVFLSVLAAAGMVFGVVYANERCSGDYRGAVYILTFCWSAFCAIASFVLALKSGC